MNKVYAVFNGCIRERTTNPLYQYDYGQELIIQGLNLPSAFEAHFCNLGDSSTITQIGQDNEVTIPDQFLQNPTTAVCYIYLHTGEDDGETEYKITIPVIARPQPTHETPTPVQQSEIDQLIIALNDGVTSASESAEDSEAWAVGERNGEPVGSGDETYHNNAKYYAEQSGDIYDSIPSEVQRVLQEALDSGEFDGRGIESVTLNPDYTLTLYFTDGTSWTSTSIRGAQGEQGVQGETGNGIQSAELNADYTLTLNYTNGTSYTTPSIRGAQGERGADGTNGVGITSIYKTATQGNVDTYTILFTDGTTTDFEVTNGTIQSVNGKTGANITLTSEDINHGSETIAEVLEKKAGALWDSQSGSIVSIVPDKTIKYLEKVTCNIEPAQDLHGYSNPWPSGGGKNKVPESGWEQGQIQGNGTIGPQQYAVSSPYILLDAGTYTLSRQYKNHQGNTGDGQCAYHTYTTEKVHIADSGWVTNPRTFTLTEQTYVRITTRWSTSVNLAPSDVGVTFFAQIESGSTATSWTPYSNICPISGYTEEKIEQRGKNLWSFGNQSGTRKIDISNVSDIPAGSYKFSANVTTQATSNSRTIFYLQDGTSLQANANGTSMSASVTFASPVSKIELWAGSSASGSTDKTFSYTDVQLELGSTATTYEPYNPNSQTITIQLGQTVYGGEVDSEGVLSITKAYALLDDASKWGTSSVGYIYNVDMTDRKIYNDSYTGLTSSYVPCVYGTDNYGRWNSASGLWFCIKSNTLTLDQIKADATAGKIAITYDLATPITVQLTPIQIQALQGINNLWCSTGDISVDYAADLKTYIDNAIAQLA